MKHIKIDEIIEIVEYSVAESAPWHKQFPLSVGDYNNVVDDPITKGIIMTSPCALMRLPVSPPFNLPAESVP